MKLVNNRPNVINNCVNGQKLQEFLKFNQQLDRIQKDLDNYLEQKRRLFPRFYFLSNDELLQILANAHDIKSVEKHINKFFENINGFMLVDGAPNLPDISGVVSGEREEMDFQLTRIRIAKTGNGVEGWLKALEQTTQTQVFKRIKEAYASHNLEKTQRKDWVLQHIGQAIASVSQIAWTENCEVAISDMETQPFALQDLHAGLIQ